jgi:DMSO/TMAO reductase YedYZ molybdopterin-dependent catalytic subunit
MIRRRSIVHAAACAVLLLFFGGAGSNAQTGSNPATAILTISGDVTTPLKLSAADLKAMPRTRVDVKTDTGTSTYEGVLIGELLKRAGAPLGGELHGTALTTYVLATASDGYQAVFSLAELDPSFTKNDVIVADTVDGKPLPATHAPLKIVTPKDARASRGMRMLERIEVVRLKK